MAHILVADDDPSVLKLAATVLGLDGHEVTTCASGPETLRRLGLQGGDSEPEQPELIVLDIMMAKVDGYSLARAVRENPRTRRIPILVVSALRELSQLFTATVQVEDFLCKPFTPDELARRVSRILERAGGRGA
jgi:CheY-like chemotaxis protein